MDEVADKIYILQAIPSPNRGNYDQIYSVKSTRELKGRLIKYDDYAARQRIQDLKVKCTKCEIFDIAPVLLTKDNRYWGYNDETNLLYIDQWNNFTRFAKERISQVFRELARKYARSYAVTYWHAHSFTYFHHFSKRAFTSSNITPNFLVRVNPCTVPYSTNCEVHPQCT